MDAMITIPHESVCSLEQEGKLHIDEIILDGFLYRRISNHKVMHFDSSELLRNAEDHIMILKDKRIEDENPVTTLMIDYNLFEILKKERLSIAKEENIAAYWICSNATLLDMCAKLPLDLSSMLEVKGIGQVKCDKYGIRFIKVIDDYLKGLYE